MAEGIVLYQDMIDAEDLMEQYTELLHRLDDELPDAEDEYQRARHDRYLEIRAACGATAAREIVRGDPEVAPLRKERHRLSLQRQTANKELQRLTSRHLRLRDDVNREWGRPSNQ